MIRRPPRSTQSRSSAASDVYKRQTLFSPVATTLTKALVKVVATGEKRVESLRLSDAFRAKVIDTTHDSFVFELNGSPVKIDAFIDLMTPLGLSEVSRTGVVAIARGSEKL